MTVSSWMSWEGGVDLVASTSAESTMPDVIVHVARLVHTPLGAAPSGMILIPNPQNAGGPPLMMGFVSSDPNIGAYFGPNIFAGTPFENAPVLVATIDVTTSGDTASTRITLGPNVIETSLEGLGETELINRPAEALPFVQGGIERRATKATLKINGQEIPIFVPEVGMTGGPGAVTAPIGFYAR